MLAEGTRVRVLVADDDPVVREALADLLGTEPSVELVALAADAAEAVAMSGRFVPDVALVDVKMPGGGGPRAAREIRTASPATHVVALSAYDDRQTVLEMIRAGATGYLVKGVEGDEIVSAIRRAARGEAVLAAAVTGSVLDELASRLELQDRDIEDRRLKTARVRHAIDSDAIQMVFQPIADLRERHCVGMEALARFPIEPARTPDVWFAEADEVGLGLDLELAAIAAALRECERLPTDAYLSLNASPRCLLSGLFLEAVNGFPHDRLVVEITEHAPVEDYEVLSAGLRDLREAGARLAVDDAGAGFASLRHILRLGPDIIKLDHLLTRDIDADRARHALAAALTLFASEIGATVVAEGIETESELQTLLDLDVEFGQGYYLGRPEPLPPLGSS